MAKEIERKFLVRDTKFLVGLTGQDILQGYLPGKGGLTTRIRIIDDQDAVLTLKGPRAGFSRDEFEYPVPLADGLELLSYCEDATLRKTRYHVDVGQHTWHVDVFQGPLAGLVVAEIELGAESESFARPTWLGEEVTQDRRYACKRLARQQERQLHVA